MKWMITCKEATNFISRKEEGRLSFKQRIQLMLHLGICSFCKLFYRQNKVIIKNASQIDEYTSASLSHEEKESMINKLNEE